VAQVQTNGAASCPVTVDADQPRKHSGLVSQPRSLCYKPARSRSEASTFSASKNSRAISRAARE
jgi:hypothetical protein